MTYIGIVVVISNRHLYNKKNKETLNDSNKFRTCGIPIRN